MTPAEIRQWKKLKTIADWHLGSNQPRHKTMARKAIDKYFKHFVWKRPI